MYLLERRNALKCCQNGQEVVMLSLAGRRVTHETQVAAGPSRMSNSIRCSKA